MIVGYVQNDYTRHTGPLFKQAPKQVWAAIAVSYAERIDPGSLDRGFIAELLLNEWQKLHANGIVTQKPPAKVRRRG